MKTTKLLQKIIEQKQFEKVLSRKFQNVKNSKKMVNFLIVERLF